MADAPNLIIDIIEEAIVRINHAFGLTHSGECELPFAWLLETMLLQSLDGFLDSSSRGFVTIAVETHGFDILGLFRWLRRYDVGDFRNRDVQFTLYCIKEPLPCREFPKLLAHPAASRGCSHGHQHHSDHPLSWKFT